jgi:hypothetical protein
MPWTVRPCWLAPTRDLRVMADYALGSVSTLMVGAFNGEGQNVT